VAHNSGPIRRHNVLSESHSQLEDFQAVAELQKRKPQATRMKLSNRECQKGPQQQHVWFNVEKTFGVTGTSDPNPTRRAPPLGQETAVAGLATGPLAGRS
jgi:hypothetical protein